MRCILKGLISCLLLLFFIQTVKAQDTLPKFSVEDKGDGRIVISWHNPYYNLVQVAVQRSFDSLKRFSTVFSATSPELPLNGFSDKVPPGTKYFYRIFYVMQGGTYYFTRSRKPGSNDNDQAIEYDTRRDQLNEGLLDRMEKLDSGKIEPGSDNRPIYVKAKDSLFTMMPSRFRDFRDSILTRTNDTLVQISGDTVSIEPYAPPFTQRSSQYVFTDRDGFIVVKLPDANKKYELVFLEEDDTLVLEFKSIKQQQFTIDKTNFYHGGWYKFEIRENGRIKERNKVFLPSDF